MKGYKNLRVEESIYTELFKLKAAAEVAQGRPVSFDAILAEMIGIYQSIISGGKITKTPIKQ